MEVYLDNSATTKPYNQVVDEMCTALRDDFANPSSAYRKGFLVEKKIKKIRENIANTIGDEDKSIIFTLKKLPHLVQQLKKFRIIITDALLSHQHSYQVGKQVLHQIPYELQFFHLYAYGTPLLHMRRLQKL